MYRNLLETVGSCCVGLFYYITTIEHDKDLENCLVVLCGCEYIVRIGV